MTNKNRNAVHTQFLWAVLLSGAAGCSAVAASLSVVVPAARAIDGDSIAIEIRLKGIDAFEHDAVCADRNNRCTACGKLAQNQLAEIIEHGQRSGSIKITFSRSHSYDRIVATAETSGIDAGEAMIASGYAIPLPEYLRDDPARKDQYLRAYEQAKAEQRGAFSGNWVSPKDWRSGKRLQCENRS